MSKKAVTGVVSMPRTVPGWEGISTVPDVVARKRRVMRREWTELEYATWVDLSEETDCRSLSDALISTNKPATFVVAKSFRIVEVLPDENALSKGWTTAHKVSKYDDGDGDPDFWWGDPSEYFDDGGSEGFCRSSYNGNDGSGSGLDADLLDGTPVKSKVA